MDWLMLGTWLRRERERKRERDRQRDQEAWEDVTCYMSRTFGSTLAYIEGVLDNDEDFSDAQTKIAEIRRALTAMHEDPYLPKGMLDVRVVRQQLREMRDLANDEAKRLVDQYRPYVRDLLREK